MHQPIPLTPILSVPHIKCQLYVFPPDHNPAYIFVAKFFSDTRLMPNTRASSACDPRTPADNVH